jgi:hypothetical protein
MLSFKTISKTTASLSLTLLAAGFAHAQGPASTSGSTDIYNTDFQKTFATGKSDATGNSNPLTNRAQVSIGSTDIYQTDFQKTFPSAPPTRNLSATEPYTGSTNIYSTNFQRAFM